jgi:hypothetical protein
MQVTRTVSTAINFLQPRPVVSPLARSSAPSAVYSPLTGVQRSSVVDFISDTRALSRDVAAARRATRAELGTVDVDHIYEVTSTVETQVEHAAVLGTVSTGTLSIPDQVTEGRNRPLADLTQFDSVVAGTLRINNHNISVAPATSTVAGLVATIDSFGNLVSTLTASDQMTLRRNNPSNPVNVQSDTSGFLLATGLVTTIPQSWTGTRTSPVMALTDLVESESTLAMADTTYFASVTTGTLTVNGTDIAIDPTTMSMEDVLAAIDATALATTSWDGSTLTIQAASGGLLELNDTSDFLGSIGLSAGNWGSDAWTETVIETITEDVTVTSERPRASNGRLVQQLQHVADRVSALFRYRAGDLAEDGALSNARSTFRDALLAGFDGTGTTRSNGFGFRVNLGSLRRNQVATSDVFAFRGSDLRNLRSTLSANPIAVRDFLLGVDGEVGFLDRIDGAISTAQSGLFGRYGPVGGLLRVTL